MSIPITQADRLIRQIVDSLAQIELDFKVGKIPEHDDWEDLDFDGSREMAEESEAVIEAKTKGLRCIGFGRWVDERGHLVAFTSKGGKLVKYDPR